MRQFNVKLLCCIGLVISFGLVIGCGSSDLLDEKGEMYTYSMSLDDGGELEVQVDILQTNCDGNLTSADDDEDFFPTLATITVSIDSDAAGLNLDNYTIDYIPVSSPNGNNLIQTPPQLLSPAVAPLTWHISAGATDSETIPVISIDTKEDYRNLIGYIQDPSTLEVFAAPALANAYYTIQITLFFTDDFGESRTKVITRTVLFGPWDNC